MIRLRPDDKEAFVAAADGAGIETGIAARTIIELVIRRIRDGQTFFQAVGELERALLTERLRRPGANPPSPPERRSGSRVSLRHWRWR